MRQFLISLGTLLVLFLLTGIAWHWKLVLALAGVGFGYYGGSFEWKRTEARVDPRNVVIIYFSESTTYGIMTILLLITLLSPSSLVRLVRSFETHTWFVESFALFLVAIITAYNLAFYRGAKLFESTRGPLRVKSFYARGVTGPEGMISKHGTVLEPCNPAGKVKIGPEIWNAESIDRRPISEGERVVVKDVEGLKVMVERSTGADEETTQVRESSADTLIRKTGERVILGLVGGTAAFFALGLLGIGVSYLLGAAGSRTADTTMTITAGVFVFLGVYMSVISWRLLTGKGAAHGGGILSPLGWYLTGLVFFGLAGILLWAGGLGPAIWGVLYAVIFGVSCIAAARLRARQADEKSREQGSAEHSRRDKAERG